MTKTVTSRVNLEDEDMITTDGHSRLSSRQTIAGAK